MSAVQDSQTVRDGTAPATEMVLSDYDRDMVEIAYHETVDEAFERGASPLVAHKEGVVAASMLVSVMTGMEDEEAKRWVVALGLRPRNIPDHLRVRPGRAGWGKVDEATLDSVRIGAAATVH